MSIVTEAPLQIYCSALVFAPPRSLVRKRLLHKLPPWICRARETREGWDANVLTFEVGRDTVEDLAFSPDGRILACGAGSEIRLWDPITGALRGALGINGLLWKLAFSPDGRFLAYHYVGDGTRHVGLLDLALQAVRGGHASDKSYSSSPALAFSPDSELLAAAVAARVQLFDTSIMEFCMGIEVSTEVNSLAFSPTGQLLAIEEIARIELWDFRRRKREVDLRQDHGGLSVGCFSPDGKFFAFGTEDLSVKIWVVAERDLYNSRLSHASRIMGLAFSPDGRLLASTCTEECIVWDVGTSKRRYSIPIHHYFSKAPLISPDGQLLALKIERGRLDLIPTVPRMQHSTLEADVFSEAQAFSPDGLYFAWGVGRGIVSIRESSILSPFETYITTSRMMAAVAFS